jgi:hypothetical protein
LAFNYEFLSSISAASCSNLAFSSSDSSFGSSGFEFVLPVGFEVALPVVVLSTGYAPSSASLGMNLPPLNEQPSTFTSYYIDCSLGSSCLSAHSDGRA